VRTTEQKIGQELFLFFLFNLLVRSEKVKKKT